MTPLMIQMYKQAKVLLLTILEEAEEQSVSFDQLLVPVGGGGLSTGVSAYLKDQAPEIKIVGVEASGARSMKAAFGKKVALLSWSILINSQMVLQFKKLEKQLMRWLAKMLIN